MPGPCPRCQAPLNDGDFAGVRLAMCEGCASVLVPTSGLVALLRSVGADLNEAEVQSPPQSDADEGARACPSCSKPMERFAYMGTGEVMLDRCNSCSHLFLDVEEVGDAASLYVRTQNRVAYRRQENVAHLERMAEIASRVELRRRLQVRFIPL